MEKIYFVLLSERSLDVVGITRVNVRGGADNSLARPTSRCRRTESIVSLERGAC